MTEFIIVVVVVNCVLSILTKNIHSFWGWLCSLAGWFSVYITGG